MNNFTFFGEVMDGGGKRVGYGPIMTFTAGTSTGEGWGASKAKTLEQIIESGVMWSIKNSKKMTLMISTIRNIHQFKFQVNTKVPRFDLQIMEKGRKLKTLHFREVDVGKIIPVELKDREIQGVRHAFSLSSYKEVQMTVDPALISVA